MVDGVKDGGGRDFYVQVKRTHAEPSCKTHVERISDGIVVFYYWIRIYLKVLNLFIYEPYCSLGTDINNKKGKRYCTFNTRPTEKVEKSTYL